MPGAKDPDYVLQRFINGPSLVMCMAKKKIVFIKNDYILPLSDYIRLYFGKKCPYNQAFHFANPEYAEI